MGSGLLNVDVALVREALLNLAGDIEWILNKADAASGWDIHERRCDAGLQVVRLRAALNNGDLDCAAVDGRTLAALQNAWRTIKELKYGEHHSHPERYRGPLHLPGEIRPLAAGMGVRPAHERYDPIDGLDAEIFPETQRAKAAKQLKRLCKSVDSRTAELAMLASRRAGKPHLTTKRARWGGLPDLLQQYASQLRVKALPDDRLAAMEPAGDGPQVPTITYHGKRCYSIGDASAVVVDDTEDCVLQAFLESPAYDLSDLKAKSGIPRPDTTLKYLREKYSGQFAPAIRLPAGKGKGGYSVSIVASEE